MKSYRIFPSIGLARLGEAPNFFLGPEVPGAGVAELLPDGGRGPLTHHKDASLTKIRKQGARFHLFESTDGVTWQPAVLPDTAQVTWSVSLVNKKAAVERPEDPPTAPMHPQVPAGNASMVIDGGRRTISGLNQKSAPFAGKFATTDANGQLYQVDVELGQLFTDAQGRLIVVGGRGFSSAPEGTPLGRSYYHNPKWHDDVADGPVRAEIRLAPGEAPIEADGGAWVVVGPPDYAPGIDCVVTLFDVLHQLGISFFRLPADQVPSYDRDIAPLVARVRRLQWVHDDAQWTDPRLSDPRLRSRASTDQPLREAVKELILATEDVFEGHTLPTGPPFELRSFQKTMLSKWVEGDFDDTPVAQEATLTAAGLTRAALEGAAGQGLCPGIEAGILMLDPNIYFQPFDYRIDHATVKPGDLTALMAQPWQADFVKCNTEWWPTQRPDFAPQADGGKEEWMRGIQGPKRHTLLVQKSGQLGLVVRQGPDEVFVEVERAANL
ncbi:LodA/GoxA family CTQ-dependent oxidase [Hymenobacter cellulosilyticus]|uniref:LodA/GoxA family CTQ-dependent oxidase n=1 Tax=Hymenobacter cellulosilyticus TaxID=2932248 RepID=A0A8T9QGY6_9BACT|nr:LodA/GoxA family CTQ-dependent oxidase [Hymenobacter cellulosilyticus]UOQ75110.1 LodA/GoxA family CTQ-dependent oxidase [Hymenobacter cellulosilyticus]